MTDIEAIQRTAADYCQLYDDGRIDELGDVFSADAVLTHRVGGVTIDLEITGRDAITTHYSQLSAYGLGEQPEPPPGGVRVNQTIHCLVNPIIDVTGDNASASFDYFCLGLVEGRLTIVSGGRFLFHELVRDPDRWRIRKLEFVINIDPMRAG